MGACLRPAGSVRVIGARSRHCARLGGEWVLCVAPTASAASEWPAKLCVQPGCPNSVSAPLGALYKPFLFFRDFALFFRTRTTFFRTRKTSTFFQISSNFFQIDPFYSSLFYGEYTLSDRSFPVGSTPKSLTPSKNGGFLCPQARPRPRDGPAETATIFRSLNNKFQSH